MLRIGRDFGLVVAGLLIFQFFAYSMDPETQRETSDFTVGLKREAMENLLEHQKYAALQEDLYLKFYQKQIGMFQWVCDHTAFEKANTVYDPLLLYFCLRQCFYTAGAPDTWISWLFGSKPSVEMLRPEIRRAYKSFLMLMIIAFADASAASTLGFKVEAESAYNFLIGKFERLWLPSILKYDFNFDMIVRELKKILLKSSESQSIEIKETFLDKQLKSAAWISCSQASWNTFKFGQPDEARHSLFEERKEDVKAARRVAILKILEVIDKLKAPTLAGKISEFAAKKFADILNNSAV